MANRDAARSHSQSPFRVSLRTLMAMFALIGLCITAHQAHRRWYFENYSWYDSTLALASISNGDSVEDIAKYFDTAEIADDELAAIVHERWGYPTQEGDEIVVFSFGGESAAYLQFVNGKLVNHRSAAFGNVAFIAQANNRSIPPMVHRHGGWILSAAILATAIPIAWVLKRCGAPYGLLLLHAILCVVTYASVGRGYTFHDGVISPLSVSLIVLPPAVAVGAVLAREPRLRGAIAVAASCGFSILQQNIIVQYIPNRLG